MLKTVVEGRQVAVVGSLLGRVRCGWLMLTSASRFHFYMAHNATARLDLEPAVLSVYTIPQVL